MNLNAEMLSDALREHGFQLLPGSLREIPGRGWVFAARGPGRRVVGWAGEAGFPPLIAPLLHESIPIGRYRVNLYPWIWDNYLTLRPVLSLTPRRCDWPASFGAGDRLGMASAAQIAAMRRYPVFPVLAQQSPRELARTGRDFQSVLLDAAWGVLEAGYTGPFGADADHLQEEEQLRAAAAAGYSLYTFDLRRALARGPYPWEELPALARSVVAELAGRRIETAGGSWILQESALQEAACRYAPALEDVVRWAGILRDQGIDADLEVSVDETEEETSPEAHAFIAVYLQRRGVALWSLAPRFPGIFEKAVDYEGDVTGFARAVTLHAAVARAFGGHRLSLHSGSEKFRILSIFREATVGCFHVKTSGTTWLQAVRVIARVHPGLFAELYAIARAHLEESRRDYPIALRPEDLPTALPGHPEAALADRAVRQLFHISYGVLLRERGAAIRELLERHEREHHAAVWGNLERHLEALLK
ncbi:tagaturonate epimerase family protein [Thermoflexus sp.]|uniref:tagaturonate epimerase family protein n=1 Tax=Thermoflexus sp. TaxID=1969742 RepID=UPI0035E42BC0